MSVTVAAIATISTEIAFCFAMALAPRFMDRVMGPVWQAIKVALIPKRFR